MQTLRLLKADPGIRGHDGEMLACAYTPDGKSVLSAGWDGHLRLWEAEEGRPVAAVKAGPKPLSACGVTPDGKAWLAGSMDGLLARWDPMTQQQTSMFLAHTRPISALVHPGDGGSLASSSWDGQIILWKPGREREGRTLAGHKDIVAGCGFTPDGNQLLSWSYDGTWRLWETALGRCAGVLPGHSDRVTAGAVCPDGRWFATGSRDGEVKLWELPDGREAAAGKLRGEVRACFFLLDAQSLVAVDAEGRVNLFDVPGLEPRAELATRLHVQCASLSPSGGQIALGCADGNLRLVAVDGFDGNPLLTTLTRTCRTGPGNLLERLIGRKRLVPAYHCTCPACRQSFELSNPRPGQPAACPHCQRNLRLNTFVRVAEGVAS